MKSRFWGLTHQPSLTLTFPLQVSEQQVCEVHAQGGNDEESRGDLRFLHSGKIF